jgi:hypothetical protein
MVFILTITIVNIDFQIKSIFVNIYSMEKSDKTTDRIIFGECGMFTFSFCKN